MMDGQQLWRFALRTIVFLLISAVLMYVALKSFSISTYVELLLVAKALSLLGLMAIGGELIRRALRRASWILPNYIIVLNGAVILTAIGAFVIVVLNLFWAADICKLGKEWICNYHAPIAALPIVGYALVNLTGAVFETFRRSGLREVAQTAICFFSFVDIPCVVPILVIMAIGYFAGFGGGPERDIFLSGAVAMFLLTSNLLTIAVTSLIIETAEPALAGDDPNAPEPA